MNKVILNGRLGQNPERVKLDGNVSLVKISIATDESYTNAKGEKVKKTEWHNIVVWGKNADNVEKYLAKGSKVLIEGKLSTRSWDDKDSGKKRYATEIVAMSVQFQDSRPVEKTA